MVHIEDGHRPTDATVSVIAASICAHVLSLAIPLALLQTYDRILPNEAYTTTFVLVVGVTVAIVLEAALRYGRSVLYAQIGAAFESRTVLRLFDHLMRADGKAVHRLGAPALSDAVRAVGQVRDFWSGNAAAALHELPFVAIYIGLIAYIATWLALVPLALTVVALIAALVIARGAGRAVVDVEAAEARRRDLTWGIFGGIGEIKAMAAETLLTQRYRDAVAQTMDARARVENQMALIRENGALLSQLSTIAVVTWGAFMVISGELTTGGLAACTLLAGRSIGPTMAAFSYLGRLGHRREAESKIAEVLSLPEAPLWTGGNGERVFDGGTIEIAGDAIEGRSVTIPQGNIVRVEASDSLTATALLEAVALLDASLGLTVTFNGLRRSAYDCQSLNHRIAMVAAHPDVHRGTLLDNLTLFSPQYNADAIRLMERLGLNGFVDGLRRGVMTPLGPAGSDIVSPGIAVRIGLVRALVRRPAVLCIDDVGGALDLDGMRRLVETLRTLKGHITILLVSGNPTLRELADQTIRVERSGRHE